MTLKVTQYDRKMTHWYAIISYYRSVPSSSLSCTIIEILPLLQLWDYLWPWEIVQFDKTVEITSHVWFPIPI